jgi:chromosome segregation ATPase
MRAANQQDLIYKRGQAGVTKASVTIVFDNSDRAKSPTGFETFRQITVTRQVRLKHSFSSSYSTNRSLTLIVNASDRPPQRV